MNNTIIDNCEYYTLLQNSELACVKCTNGYTGSISADNIIT